jgi:hypothetical protein
MVTFHKGFAHVIDITIPQNHQFVNRLFVILSKKGVIIYNFFLFWPRGGGISPKQADWAFCGRGSASCASCHSRVARDRFGKKTGYGTGGGGFREVRP